MNIFSIRGIFVLVLTTLCSCYQTSITLDEMEGDGTAENPFLVTNEQQLRLVGRYPEKGFSLKAHYRQTTDIALGNAAWERIGDSGHAGTANADPYIPDNYFSGTYDGGGHTISNFNYHETITFNGGTSNSIGHGMFGAVGNGGVVKNLTVIGDLEVDYVLGRGAATGQIRNTGGVVGFLDGGTVRNVAFKGRVKAGDEDSSVPTDNGNNGRRIGARVGGVVGYLYAPTATNNTGINAGNIVEDCRFEGTVIAYLQVGGVVGHLENDLTDRGTKVSGCSYDPGDGGFIQGNRRVGLVIGNLAANTTAENLSTTGSMALNRKLVGIDPSSNSTSYNGMIGNIGGIYIP